MSALVCIETPDDAKAVAVAITHSMFTSGLAAPAFGKAPPKGKKPESQCDREYRELVLDTFYQGVMRDHEHLSALLDAIEALATPWTP